MWKPLDSTLDPSQILFQQGVIFYHLWLYTLIYLHFQSLKIPVGLITCIASLFTGKMVSGSSMGPLALYFKTFIRSCTYCWYFRCTTLIVRVRGMPWPQTGALPCIVRISKLIKGLVVCYVVRLGSMIYEIGIWISARCVVWSMPINLKYRNTPYRQTDTYNNIQNLSNQEEKKINL